MQIDIIVESRRDLRSKHHMAFLMEYWRDAGHTVQTVQVFSSGAAGEIGILHIDLTFIDEAIIDWAKRYPKLVNGGVIDISKRTVSNQLVALDDSYFGPVIIKTDLNRGGKPEMKRERSWFIRDPLAAIRREVARNGWWRQARILPPNDYPVLPSKDEVPAWVWRDDRLVVEKFMPERVGDLYASRIWVFLGDRGYGRLELSESPTGRGSSAVQRSYITEVAPEVRSFREKHCMEFGKIDWAYSTEGAVVFDANRTPSRVTVPSGQDREVMSELSKGISAFASI